MKSDDERSLYVRYDLDDPDAVEDYFMRWGSYTHRAREQFFPGWDAASLHARRVQQHATPPLSRGGVDDGFVFPEEDILKSGNFTLVDVAHNRTGLKYRAEIYQLHQDPTDASLHAGVWVWRYDQVGGGRLLSVELNTAHDSLFMSDYIGPNRRVSHKLGTENLDYAYEYRDGELEIPHDHWLAVPLDMMEGRNIRVYREACGAAFIGLAANLTRDPNNTESLDRALYLSGSAFGER